MESSPRILKLDDSLLREIYNDDAPSINITEDSSSEEEDATALIEEEFYCETTCLFCPLVFIRVAEALSHCSAQHDFFLSDINADQYGFIKMVNYVRKHSESPADIMAKFQLSPHPWMNEEYLIPFSYNDGWLLFDFENFRELSKKSDEMMNNNTGNMRRGKNMRFPLNDEKENVKKWGKGAKVNSGGFGKKNDSENGNGRLKNTCAWKTVNACKNDATGNEKMTSAERQLLENLKMENMTLKKESLERKKNFLDVEEGTLQFKKGLRDMRDLSKFLYAMLEETNKKLDDLDLKENGYQNHSLENIAESLRKFEKGMQSQQKQTKALIEKAISVGKKTLNICKSYGMKETEESVHYFSSYGSVDIHREMISDDVRTGSYETAILGNSASFKGKTILDVGCGTGILSIFAARADAKKIYAVDCSNIMRFIDETIIANNLDHKIFPIKSTIEELALNEKVDVILSEWMGYFLLYENMLQSVLFARDNFLKDDGEIFPNVFNMYVCGICDEDGYDDAVHFWNNVRGAAFPGLAREEGMDAVVTEIDGDKVTTTCATIATFDLRTCSPDDADFSTYASMTALQKTTVHAFVGYFDTVFDARKRVEFSTGPHYPYTHWKQTVFWLDKPIHLVKGQTLEPLVSCDRVDDAPRTYRIIFMIDKNNYTFYLR